MGEVIVAGLTLIGAIRVLKWIVGIYNIALQKLNGLKNKRFSKKLSYQHKSKKRTTAKTPNKSEKEVKSVFD